MNLHPGNIPMNRGLDNLKWSIVKQFPITVTSHFISEKIDLGKIIMKSNIKIYKDDTIYDVSSRHFFNEFKVMIASLALLEKKHKLTKPFGVDNYFSALPFKLDKKLDYYFKLYKKKFHQKLS